MSLFTWDYSAVSNMPRSSVPPGLVEHDLVECRKGTWKATLAGDRWALQTRARWEASVAELTFWLVPVAGATVVLGVVDVDEHELVKIASGLVRGEEVSLPGRALRGRPAQLLTADSRPWRPWNDGGTPWWDCRGWQRGRATHRAALMRAQDENPTVELAIATSERSGRAPPDWAMDAARRLCVLPIADARQAQMSLV